MSETYKPPGAETFRANKNEGVESSKELKEVTGFGVYTNGNEVLTISGETRKMEVSYPSESIGKFFENGGILGFVDGEGQMRVEKVLGNESKRDKIIKTLKDAGYQVGNLSIPLTPNEKFVNESLQSRFDAEWN